MTSINFEILLGNFSFVILFLLMVFYWIQALFSIIPKFHFIIFLTTGCANLSLLSLLIIRWIHYGHFPLSNLYESLVFLSWSFTLIQLIFIGFLSQYTFQFRNVNSINYTTLIGIVVSPIALFTNSFATFSLPKTMQKAQALVPALQSNWLMMHVTVMMLSYTALLCGSLLSITFLIITWRETKNFTHFKHKNAISNSTWTTTTTLSANQLHNCEKTPYTLSQQTSHAENNFLEQNQSKTTLELELSGFTKTLDNLSYRILGIGFPLLTIGILSGAVWANEAWGSYWSWDPKETWAFITWLIFAIYLHTRITKGWEGKKPAILASFGFFLVWICYLGVNIVGTGLHSYGWMHFKA